MLEAMSADEPRGRGRPPKGRKIVVQAGLEPEEFQQVERLAERKGSAMSSVLRELILDGLAAQKKGGRK